MTSCPSEEELVLFVEDALDADAADAVGDHLTACADCRRLVARSEAALRYALAGVAEREHLRPVRAAELQHRFPWRTTAAAAAVLAAAAALAWSAREATLPVEVQVAAPATPRVVPVRALTLDERLDALLARARELEAPAAEAVPDDTALAALAAAEARVDLGLPTAAARFQDVMDRFPGTPEAREARARIALLGGER